VLNVETLPVIVIVKLQRATNSYWEKRIYTNHVADIAIILRRNNDDYTRGFTAENRRYAAIRGGISAYRCVPPVLCGRNKKR